MRGESYVCRNGKIVLKSKAAPQVGGFVLRDIDPFTTQDGKHITSRSHLRAYEQANGIKQIGNDMATETAEIRRRAGR